MAAPFSDLDPLLHSQLRLAVMSLLLSVREAKFNFLKEKTGATPDPAIGALQPQYAAMPNGAALPNYFRTDFSASKFVRRPNKAGSLVLFAVLSNVFNTENVSGYTYSADYQQTAPTLFQRRLFYSGLVKTWQ